MFLTLKTAPVSWGHHLSQSSFAEGLCSINDVKEVGCMCGDQIGNPSVLVNG